MPASPTPSLRFATGLSCVSDTKAAARQAGEAARERLERAGVDLVMAFFSPHHLEHAQDLSRTLREVMGGAPLVGMSAQAVIEGSREVERAPGVAVFAASLPGVRIKTFCDDDLPVVEDADEARRTWAGPLGIDDAARATLLFADPTSVPIMTLLPWFNAGVRGHRDAAAHDPVLVGGLASASGKGGGNAVLIGERVKRHGLTGVTLGGPLHVDCVLSQGCKPIGPVMVVTKSKANLIFELSGRPVIDVIQQVIESLGEGAQHSVRNGLMLGMVIDERKPRFGRNDFLMRGIVGADAERGCIAVADFPKVGQSVRLHVRDRQTAREDLALLLDAHRLYDPPLASLLITCNGRGERLFGIANHDAGAVQRAFTPPPPGEEASAAGTVIEPGVRHEPIPQCGFFAAGEIGPIGGTSFLHGQTACAVLFRGMEGASG